MKRQVLPYRKGLIFILLGLLILTVATVQAANLSETDKLTADDAAVGDEFGTSVAVDGTMVVVGASEDDDGGSDSGSAYVFDCNSLSCTQVSKLTASDAAQYDYFGYSVAVAGTTVVVGAYGDDFYSGSAYVFLHLIESAAIDSLRADIQALAADGTLKAGQANGLIRPLDNALSSLEVGHFDDACNQLQDFIDKVYEKTPVPLDEETAAGLIADAQAIRSSLGCN